MEHLNAKAEAESAAIISRLRNHVSLTESSLTEPMYRIIQNSLEQMYWAGIADYIKGKNNAENQPQGNEDAEH